MSIQTNLPSVFTPNNLLWSSGLEMTFLSTQLYAPNLISSVGMIVASAWRQMILYRLAGSEVSAPVRYLTHPITLIAAQLIDNTPVLKIPTFAASSWLLWKNTASQEGNMGQISTTTALVTQVASVVTLLCPSASGIRNLFIPLIVADDEFKRKEAEIIRRYEEGRKERIDFFQNSIFKLKVV